MFRFESPWMLLLLLPLAALVVWRFRERVRLALLINRDSRAIAATWRSRLGRLPLLLRALALAALVVALARPQHGTERVRDISQGIAIAMVVDRSSSMGERIQYAGRNVTRLEAVKQVFKDFIDPNEGEMGGRPNDLIGMTAFAQYADSVCPLTLSHATLIQLLDSVQLVVDRREDGTAIGDAVALAAARLERAEESLERIGEAAHDYEIKSKIIILLTDGENNAGDRSVRDAAELCKRWALRSTRSGSVTSEDCRRPSGDSVRRCGPGLMIARCAELPN